MKKEKRPKKPLKKQSYILARNTVVESKEQKNSELIVGTKLIRSDQTMRDIVFDTIDERINRELSVLFWTYTTDKGLATLEVEFIDESPVLRVSLNPYNIDELQFALKTIDDYFLNKQFRS